jgi:ABC-type multidrug transport system fused ATPase/permease subunit
MSEIHLVNSFSAKLHFFWNVLKKHRKYIWGIIGMEIILSLFNALIPYFTKFQIDQLEKQTTHFYFLGNLNPFIIFILLLLIPAAIELLRLFFFEKVNRKISSRFDTELQLDTEKFVWEKLKTLDAGFFENQRNKKILTSALGSTRVTNDFFRFLRSRIGEIVTVTAIIPLLALVSWQLLLLVSMVTILQMLLSEVSRKQEVAMNALIDKQREEYWKYESALTYDFHALRILGATQHFMDRYHELLRERERFDLRKENANEVLRTYEWILRNGLTILANLFVGYEVLQGRLSLGTFTLVVSYTLQINNIFRNVLESTRSWRDIDLQLDRLRFFSLLQPRIKKSAIAITDFSDIKKIDFKEVHFKYPDLFAEEKEYLNMLINKTKGFLDKFASYGYQYEFDEWKKLLEEEEEKKPVLKGVNIELEKGKIVALLGRNGAGKTTITNLVMHHYEPEKGQILLNEKPLYEYDQNLLLQQFGVIQQRPFILYRFTIRENLLLGVHRKVTEEEIWDMLEKLDMKKTVEGYDKKIDTMLGEGVNLSGGQEQLIAVARILLQQRRFLIFDEGMNQMDIEHETAVMNLLKEQAKHAGILFITHRITTARKADYIYMLDEGIISEEGTHDELLKRNGLYAKFWNMQVIE